MKDANTLLHQIEETADDIGLKINSDKTEYMRLNPNSYDGKMKRTNFNIIKQVENFKYLGSYIESTENDIEIIIAKAWSALNSMGAGTGGVWGVATPPGKIKGGF